jgi:hypothetical protein
MHFLTKFLRITCWGYGSKRNESLVSNFERKKKIFFVGFYLQDFALLQHFSGNVQWQVLGVDDTANKVQVLWHELFAVLHDEHTSHVQLDRVLLFAVLEQVESGTLGHKQQGSELELTLDAEVLDGQMVFPVVGQRLVELAVLRLRNVFGVAGPQRLGLVQLFLLLELLLDLLLLLLVFVTCLRFKLDFFFNLLK